MTNEETKALRRYCGAVLEYRHLPPYKSHVKKACEDMKDGSVSDEQHDTIMKAIILNTLNRKDYPYNTLQRQYDLPMTRYEFTAKKNEFCVALAKRCGFPSAAAGSFSKKDILDMLFVIADEANECITKDGSFNHQVAGVALKAIDQAMRIYDSCEDTAEDTREIRMDDPARAMGA